MMKEAKILDKGFVRLVDVMGDDSSIVQAARVSYGGGIKTEEEDKKLINYLMKHRHTSPFEMVEFKFHIKAPIFVARQWMRHRTASINEISGRYTEMKEEYYVPEIEMIKLQDTINKQGSFNKHPDGELHHIDINRSSADSFYAYKNMIDDDVARETARIVLPLSTYTEWYWKIDLHNLFNFLKLRLDSHAQYEIREYAIAIAQFVRDVVPVSYVAFQTYVLNTIAFDLDEIWELKALIDREIAESLDYTRLTNITSKSGRLEFKNKIKRILEID